MTLTQKDMAFLEKLKQLLDAKDLTVELRPGKPSHMILKGTYGEKIHTTFKMTRQGVRWRFWHLFNKTYVEAFQTILLIEKIFGTQLRDYAVRIARERYTLRQEIAEKGFQSADSLNSRR